ncbi:hypothetical protein UFOVP1217_119 [uncultured Caudovirales phage]|uniref:Tyrosine specific protein phosphatases domain-containing protein n=1 Tax=uncultured Caudovirales phage TaxID=2100421 RepID=A0A6J5SHC6_9CAUD|nr:hypothetical protein UFOVP465_9 [uncultured Caudovirales phage]CAB4156327.1 hypothetical protein UFOVP666_55 [uncultured Caudovirales phage]CAB4160331.1 hypothetical protein UFOVP727_132 [uncultured Caudovirales phage]CAB4164735.1 hypothetical protein UFOVP819_83 [uncultured Caudovirales phage]CAB4171624.1 hypothetical protein UFOVP926_4 [uncultured Caudovirales phage]
MVTVRSDYTYGMDNINIPKTTLITELPTVMNLKEAQLNCRDFDAVITAGPSKREVSNFGHPIHKVVEFHDTMYEDNGGPSYKNVAELIEFGAGVPKLLVHCHAGISRSTATAWGVAIANGQEPLDAFLELQRNHPNESSVFGRGFKRTFAPNILIVKHLDKYFNLGTTLLEIRDKHTEGGW